MPKATFLKERTIIFPMIQERTCRTYGLNWKGLTKYLRRLTVSPEARFLSIMDSVGFFFFFGIWWGPRGCLQRGSVIGPLTWQLFGIPCQAYKTFFIFHEILSFLVWCVLHASMNQDVNHNIFISVMGWVEIELCRDDRRAQFLIRNTK